MSNYTLRQALEMCRDYLSCIPESAVGGDDDAVRLTRIATGALGAADDEPQCEAGFGINGEQLSWLLISSLKSDEIAGPPEVRQKRVRELLHWFVRLTQGWANPKWLYGHAMELAYHIATNDVNRGIDLSAIEQGVELSDYPPLPAATGWANKANLVSAHLGRDRYGNAGACELHTWREGGPVDHHTEALYTADQMRAYVDADRKARGAQP